VEDNDLKISLTIFVTVILFLTFACGKSKPSPEAISASLNSFVKKDNPNAKVEGISLEPSNNDTLMTVKFGYKDFTYTSKKGEKKTESGTGSATIDGLSGKWVLETVMINYGTADGEVWNPGTEVK
jgi:hypothetical protein